MIFLLPLINLCGTLGTISFRVAFLVHGTCSWTVFPTCWECRHCLEIQQNPSCYSAIFLLLLLRGCHPTTSVPLVSPPAGGYFWLLLSIQQAPFPAVYILHSNKLPTFATSSPLVSHFSAFSFSCSKLSLLSSLEDLQFQSHFFGAVESSLKSCMVSMMTLQLPQLLPSLSLKIDTPRTAWFKPWMLPSQNLNCRSIRLPVVGFFFLFFWLLFWSI